MVAAVMKDAVQIEGNDLGRGALLRPALFAFAWLNVGLGLAGLFLPVMPTTVFLLVALWAFSKSSRRFHDWLFDHPRLGRSLRDWRRHGVIPARAKALALATMAASLAYVTLFTSPHWALPVALGFTLSAVAAFILSRPSRPHAIRT
jgi:uncharacterized membrane protein YbaN (DUF454 family)